MAAIQKDKEIMNGHNDPGKNNATEHGHGHPFGFPFQPYPIQVQLMEAIYESAEKGKIAIMESPTGTGKSLSTICAALTWLENVEKRRHDEVERGINELNLTIKEASNARDWLNVSKEKMIAQQKLEELREEQGKQQKIAEKLEKARKSVNKTRGTVGKSLKRRHAGGFGFDNENKVDDDDNDASAKANDADKNVDLDLIPSDGENNNDDDEEYKYTKKHSPTKEKEIKEEDTPPSQCRKLIYASRTHSQLEQFANELEKTQFRPRLLTLGSRQILCVNDAVRQLHSTGLINDRCNELLSASGGAGQKKGKMENGTTTRKPKKCGCEYANPNAIEDFSDSILVANEAQQQAAAVQKIPDLISEGRDRLACPYFATKAALGLGQLLLVPYNILLHKGTRKAWNLDLKGNVVIVDEAHNLLQTLASIHSVELNALQLDNCCRCLCDYLDRFRSRLSPRNLRNIRQLHNLALSLQRFLNSFKQLETPQAAKAKVFTLPQFFIQIGDSINIDIFRLLTYLEESKLCKKLRDFHLRYQPTIGLKTKDKFKETQNQNAKDSKPDSTHSTQHNVSSTSTPLYQLREFLEAVTMRSEDARIVVERANGNGPKQSEFRLRFILLNPAEKLREIVAECHSLILLGGTMRPVDQLLDAFKRVCRIPAERIVEFSCGHVVSPKQLIAISIGSSADGTQLSLQFDNRESAQMLRSLAQSVVNLTRHIPNGMVAFFPSYAFLGTFIQSIHSSGHFAQLEKLKTLFVEARSDNEENKDIWPKFCHAARTPRGAFLMAVVGGKLSEGINFSDELGRCVLMIGLPYPNRQSVELQERMRFVDENVAPGAGNRLYEQLCLQSVNQAIGRAIRHKNDYAAILLLDHRFTRPNLENGLPGWIRQRLHRSKAFPEALGALISFFRSQRSVEKKEENTS